MDSEEEDSRVIFHQLGEDDDTDSRRSEINDTDDELLELEEIPHIRYGDQSSDNEEDDDDEDSSNDYNISMEQHGSMPFMPMVTPSGLLGEMLMSMFDIGSSNFLVGDAIDNYYLDLAIQESTEQYQFMERKNIQLQIDTTPYSESNQCETKCGVCQEDFGEEEDVVQLKCNHIFHEQCIRNWGEFKPECPMCRTKIEHTFQN